MIVIKLRNSGGLSDVGGSWSTPADTFRVNALGTWHVLQAVRDAAPAARVLVAGSGEIYGPQPAGSRVAENWPSTLFRCARSRS